MSDIKSIVENYELQSELKNNKNVIALFSASWCGPCKTIKPLYQQYSQDSKYVNIQFLYIDIDDADDLCNLYKIKSVPTFILFIDGKVCEQMQGVDRNRLVEILDSTL